MAAEIKSGEYLFCTVSGNYSDYAHLDLLASFVESEDLTLAVLLEAAGVAQLPYESTFRRITLKLHSSLDAVGLTAAVATKLASYNIRANVVAAYCHNHIFVQSEKADEALLALQEFGVAENQSK